MMDPSTSQSQNTMICGGGSKVTVQRSRSHCFSQNYNKLLNEGASLSRKVYESVAVSNAVELFKLIFLCSSTSTRASTVLAETLRRYSQHDLFAAFSYLREKKMMVNIFFSFFTANCCSMNYKPFFTYFYDHTNISK